MRLDILKSIKNASEITNAVILTHNIDFVFVQSVVITALRKCGSPALTIFADAECTEQTYQKSTIDDSGGAEKPTGAYGIHGFVAVRCVQFFHDPAEMIFHGKLRKMQVCRDLLIS
jgi:hypothetical protein